MASARTTPRPTTVPNSDVHDIRSLTATGPIDLPLRPTDRDETR